MRWWIGVLLAAAVVAIAFVMWPKERTARRDREVAADSPGEDGADSRRVPERFSLFAGVVRDEDGHAVEGASISGKVWPADDDEREIEPVRSDDGGRFTARGKFRHRRLHAWVRHPEYAAAEANLRADEGEPQVVVLERGVAVSLLVLSPERKPVADASVDAGLTKYDARTEMSAWIEWQRDEEGRTDAAGRLPLGRTTVCTVEAHVDHPDFAPAHVEFEVAGDAAVEQEVVMGRGGSIAGRVLDPDRAPVPGATVRAGERETRTDEHGRYLLERLAPGTVTVRAEKEGFGPARFGAALGWRQSVPVAVHEGRRREGIDLFLGRASHVTGRVVDEEGLPVPGLRMMVDVDGGYQPKPSAYTDDDGRFVDGPWSLREAGRVLVRAYESDEHLLPQREVGSLSPGGDLDVGDIEAVTKALLSGVVRPASGVDLPPETIVYVHGVVADPDGRFRVRVAPGDQRLAAYLPHGSPWRSDTLDLPGLEPGEVREDLVLTLSVIRHISGRVLHEDGTPRKHKPVACVDPALEPPYAEHLSGYGSTDENGAFALAPPTDGEYLVGLVRPLDEGFDLLPDPPPQLATAGSGGLELVFPLTLVGPIVRGRVVSGRTGAVIRKFNTVLILHRFFIPREHHHILQEDDEGRFEEEIWKEGSFAVRVTAHGHAPFQTAIFSAKRGETKDLGTIRLGDAGRIAGVLRDPAGAPIPFAQVHVLSAKLESKWAPPFTDGEGRFEIGNVTPDQYSVFAVSPAHPLCIQRGVAVGEGESVELSLTVPEASPLTLTVLDEGSRPVPGARLIYTFAALRPFTSRQVAMFEPAGYGPSEADANGRIGKPYLPAGKVSLTIEAQGFVTERRDATLEPGKEHRIEIRLRRRP